MQYDKNNYLINKETKNDFININNPKDDVLPAVMPKIKKQYIYVGAIAIVLIILMNDK